MTTTPRPPEPHRIEQLRGVCGQLSQVVTALTIVEQENVRATLRQRVAEYRARLHALGITEQTADAICAADPGYYMDAGLYAETMASRLLAMTADEIPLSRHFRAHVGEHTEGEVRTDTLADVLQPEYAAPATSQAIIRRYRSVVGVLTTTAIALGALNAVRGPLQPETSSAW